jgi:hypothetical protein
MVLHAAIDVSLLPDCDRHSHEIITPTFQKSPRTVPQRQPLVLRTPVSWGEEGRERVAARSKAIAQAPAAELERTFDMAQAIILRSPETRGHWLRARFVCHHFPSVMGSDPSR